MLVVIATARWPPLLLCAGELFSLSNKVETSETPLICKKKVEESVYRPYLKFFPSLIVENPNLVSFL